MTPTIRLVSGASVHLAEPDLAHVPIDDIAHALAHICRFTGHVRTFYSVAQHSVMVSHLVPPEMAFQGLMHDAAEAFIGDVSAPLKSLLPDYKAIERRMEAAVARRFGFELPLPAAVKTADMVALATERRDILGRDAEVWTCLEGVRELVPVIQPLPPMAAKRAFLERFVELGPPHMARLNARKGREALGLNLGR